jgi:hypothetical protein
MLPNAGIGKVTLRMENFFHGEKLHLKQILGPPHRFAASRIQTRFALGKRSTNILYRSDCQYSDLKV